jgi:hypothetical protein
VKAAMIFRIPYDCRWGGGGGGGGGLKISRIKQGCSAIAEE